MILFRYLTKFDLMSENLAKEEHELRHRILEQSKYLRDLQKEFSNKLDDDIKSLLRH